MAAHSAFISTEEYLRREEVAEVRHEYIAGRVYAMAGGTIDYGRIVSNIAGELHSALRGSGCAHFESEVKVWVESWQCFYYPDAMVVCEPNVLDARLGMIDNPLVVFEVLYDSTEGIDRGGKFAAYATLRSLRQYVLIDSRRYRAEIYTRTGGADEWAEGTLEGTEGRIELAFPNKTIALSDVYDGLKL